MLRQWLVVCLHGNCLLQFPIWLKPKHSTNLLHFWFFGKRNPGDSAALQLQLILCKLPLFNIHQTCILRIYKCHMVCTRFHSNEATLTVKRLLSFYVECIKHKVNDWLSNMAEMQCFGVAKRLYGWERAFSWFIRFPCPQKPFKRSHSCIQRH